MLTLKSKSMMERDAQSTEVSTVAVSSAYRSTSSIALQAITGSMLIDLITYVYWHKDTGEKTQAETTELTLETWQNR